MHTHRILLLWYYFWLPGKESQTITSLLDWSNVRREVSRLRLDDLSILKGAPSLKMDGLFQKREVFPSHSSSDAAGVSQIIRGQCDCDTKSAAITFTFTLRYWIFIHWALSQWVMSWMTDEADAFCLKDDGSGGINRVCRAFTLQKGDAKCKKSTKNNNEQQQKQQRNVSLYLTLNNGPIFT